MRCDVVKFGRYMEEGGQGSVSTVFLLVYQTLRRHVSEGRSRRTHRRENQNFLIIIYFGRSKASGPAKP